MELSFVIATDVHFDGSPIELRFIYFFLILNIGVRWYRPFDWIEAQMRKFGL